MREIKFRGKRVDNGDWVHGLFTMTKWQSISPFEHNGIWHEPEWEVREEFKHMVKCQEINRSRYWFAAIQQSKNFDSILEVDPDTVGQFTGLKDKNGREIYEGDICEDARRFRFVVIWEENARFLGRGIGKQKEYIRYVGQEPAVKVIGNIYENPKLLEVPK